jgi:SAM-dependent methyltransferase
MTNAHTIFDKSHYVPLNSAREDVLRKLLKSLETEMQLKTAVDVGCGVGHFSALLQGLHFDVVGVDGRAENLEEARARVPGVEFRVSDAEDIGILTLGKFDLMLCFGLWYHLENPFVAVRNLFALTGKIAVMEGVCLPGAEAILEVRDEGPTEDQGLRHVALYPTENAMVKFLYRSGFPFVYRFRAAPDHPEYRASHDRLRYRAMLAAANVPLSTDMLVLATEPVTNPDTWTVDTTVRTIRRNLSRAKRFLTKRARVTS